MDLKSWNMLRLLDKELMSKIKIAFVFGFGGNEAIIVTKEDEVFSFGSNESCCLGLGYAEPTLSPTKIEALCNKRIKGFAFGIGPFVVALTENGEVYSWGKNNFGQLGNKIPGENVSTPNIVGGELHNKQVVEIACGGYHTLALTGEGEVYFWGKNYGKDAQANTGFPFTPAPNSSRQYLNTPIKVNFDTKVTAIACGSQTSMALLESGELYGGGCNDKGQLGLGSTNAYQTSPSWISSLRHVVITKVACGFVHTLAISDDGELFEWGSNTNEQQDRRNILPANKPVCITYKIGRVVDIAAMHNSYLSAAMTSNSEVYMWGYGRGQNIINPIKTHFTSLNDVFAWGASVTPTSIRVENAGLTVADSIKKAFDEPSSSDLKIMVNGKPIHVHKAFLKIRCSHLQVALGGCWQEGNTGVYEVNDVSYEVYRSFLEYLYTDEVKLPIGDALELLDLANSYLEEDLKQKCVEIIKRGLTVENVAFVYHSIISYDNKELEESCMKFSVHHMTAVIKTAAFKNLNIERRMQFIERAAEFGAFRA